MRLTTAFNRLLRLPGASVRSVTFTDRGLIIGLRRGRRRLVCPCSWTTKARYDTPRRRWRRLDFGVCQVWLEADIHRLDSRTCGRVRTEQVPWARPGARDTSDFENIVAWLAQRMDKTSIARLLRCSWEAVDAIVCRVVIDHIDDARLNDLYRIGVDGISYKRGRKFLTIVADHDTGNVVWVGTQRSKAAFEEFFTALGPHRPRTPHQETLRRDHRCRRTRPVQLTPRRHQRQIRLIQRRGFGYKDLDSLSAMIYLCLGGVTLTLPTET